jgi:polyhydroxybutyrate depolymerase
MAKHVLQLPRARRPLWRAIIMAAVIAVAVLLTAACSAADMQKTLQLGGLERSYALYVPPSAKTGGPLPLVVVLHGGGGNGPAAARQTRFNAEADREGFIIAYPNGTDRSRPIAQLLGKKGSLTWNAGRCCGYAMDNQIDDVAFIRAMVDTIIRDFPVDRQRIYATGISNGAMMAYRLACEASDVFAAVGAVSGPVVTSRCAPANPVAVIHIHGTDDGYVPEQGGVGPKWRGLDYPSVKDTIAFWVAANGCNPTPNQSQPVTGVRLVEYGGCRNGTAVSYYSIKGGGHAWPGGDRLAFFLDAPSNAIAATPLIWQFFADHPKI